MTYDFIFDNNVPKIVEISYGFKQSVYELCPGYWDRDMHWHEGTFNPQEWMVELIISNNTK
jgi:hypothetical protein